MLYKNKILRRIFVFVTAPVILLAVLVGSFLFRSEDNIAQAAWYNSSWDYRVKITINASQVSEGTASTTYELTSGTTWTVPNDWSTTSNSIEVIGGGGGGASGSGGRAGGGGGGYSRITDTTSLTPGATITYAVGSGGGAGSGGGDTYLCSGTSNCGSLVGSAVIVGAQGGAVGGADTGGTGGASGSGVGVTKYSGGNGGSATSNGGSGAGGAGGRNGNGATGGGTSRDEGSGAGANGGGGNGRNANADGGCALGCGGTGGQINGFTFASCKGSGTNSGGSGCMGDGSRGGNGASGGGGGGGDDDTSGWRGGHGGNGIDIDATTGSGGGGGGAGQDGATGNIGGNGGLYGGGGGGASGSNTSGTGGQGIIYIQYKPDVHIDFPVYVDMSDLPDHVWNYMRSDCGDIRITTANGSTEVPREIVECNNGTQTGELHFKAPEISTTVDTEFYIYYGNAGQGDYAIDATYGAENVWTNNYAGVYHLKQDPGVAGASGILDSTTYDRDGTDEGSMDSNDDVAGQLGTALDFDGSDDNILISGLMGTPANFTISAWASLDVADTNGADAVSLGDHAVIRLDNPSNQTRAIFATSSTGWLNADTDDNLAGTSWRHLAFTFDGTYNVQRIYIDTVVEGSAEHTDAVSWAGMGSNTYIGESGNASVNLNFDGRIDEVRIASTSRTSGWIETEYNNQSSPDTFYAFQEIAEPDPVIETFTASDTWVVPAGVTSVEILAVGGGGGGGPADSSSRSGGGGGAGGLVYDAGYEVTPEDVITVTIGGGGIGGGLCCVGSQSAVGRNGSSTVFDTITAVGGGGGGNGGAGAGAGGGSGGGAGRNNTSGFGTSTAGQGNNGGGGASGATAAEGGGGGGGAGGAGSAGTSVVGGAGGAGSSYDISGASVTYAGGGGGARFNGSGGAGGSGGGGAGASASGNGTAGTANTGGGGGGAAGGGSGGAGGSGIVIIKYVPNSLSAPETPIFSQIPFNVSSTAIRMTATSTDVGDNIEMESGEFLEFYFDSDNTVCGANAGTGGTDSGWLATSTYTDVGLQPNKCYGYKITARDGFGNASVESTASSTYTSAVAPAAPTISNVGVNSFDLLNNVGDNPASSPTTTFAVQISATSPSDPTWLNQYVDATGNPSGTAVWLSDAQIDTITVNGLDSYINYQVRVKARNNDNEETGFSSVSSTTTLDGNPPTPSTPYFTSVPTNISHSAISMTSVAGSDAEGGTPLEYYFGVNSAACGMNAGGGAHDSGWQTSNSYTDSGLQTNKCYGYTIKIRDASGNTTSTSTASTTYTGAATPGAPSFVESLIFTGTLFFNSRNTNGNPTSNPVTEYAYRVSSASPADATWDGFYIDATGNPSATAVWLSDLVWGDVIIQGVATNTDYSIQGKARNQDGDETPFGTNGVGSTAAETPKDVRLRGSTRLQGTTIQ